MRSAIRTCRYLNFESLIEKNINKKKQVYLLLDGITDVRNFQQFFEILATGVNGIIIPKAIVPLNSDTIKASAGDILYSNIKSKSSE